MRLSSIFSVSFMMVFHLTGMGFAQNSSLEEQKPKVESVKLKSKDKKDDQDQSEKRDDKKKPKKKDESQFTALTPGKVNHHVEIMTYGDDSPRSSFKADSILRNHDDTLVLVGMRTRTYDWEGDSHMEVRSPLAWYQRRENLLWSWERSRIIRPDMVMEGDEMVFNLENQTGTLKGNVRVILIDFDHKASQHEDKTQTSPETSLPQSTPETPVTLPSTPLSEGDLE